MKTTRFLIAVVALVAVGTVDVSAQGFLDRLGKAAGRAAERAVTRQAEKRAEDAVNKTIDGALDGKSEEEQQQQNQQGNNPRRSGCTGQSAGSYRTAGRAIIRNDLRQERLCSR